MRGGETPGVHTSVHQGVVVYREGDYYGRVVNLAARLLGLAGRDELVVSETVASATAGRFAWESRGDHAIRGFSDPICVYRLLVESPRLTYEPAASTRLKLGQVAKAASWRSLFSAHRSPA